MLGVPVEEAEISWPRQQLLFTFKDVSEVLGLEPVRQVDVPRHFVVTLLLLANENYGCHTATAHIGLAVSKRSQELRVVNLAAGVA